MTATSIDMTPILALPIDERVELARSIQEGVEREIESYELSDEMKAELDRRRAEHDADPSTAVSWEVVKAELLSGVVR